MFDFLAPKVPQIEVDKVKRAIDSKGDIDLLDVRTPQEFVKGNITRSINIPVDDIQNRVEKALPDKSRTIYVYCLSGLRSVHAVNTMIKLGYTHAYSMTSGLLAWRTKNYPLNDNKE